VRLAPTTKIINSYVWLIQSQDAPINADTLDDFTVRLNTLESKMTADYPGPDHLRSAAQADREYTTRLSTINGPVLAALWYSADLDAVSYRRDGGGWLALWSGKAGEWASMASRGASVLQLVFMQAQA